MIDGVAAVIHRIAHDRAEFAGERIREYGLALYQAGIAVTRFLSRLTPVDENDVAAALLQMQRHAYPHHSSSQNDHIRAGAHPARSPISSTKPRDYLVCPRFSEIPGSSYRCERLKCGNHKSTSFFLDAFGRSTRHAARPDRGERRPLPQGDARLLLGAALAEAALRGAHARRLSLHGGRLRPSGHADHIASRARGNPNSRPLIVSIICARSARRTTHRSRTRDRTGEGGSWRWPPALTFRPRAPPL